MYITMRSAALKRALSTTASAGKQKPEGYQGFGSFHSDNVEELVRQPGWHPGACPVDLDDITADYSTCDPPKFGKEMLQQEFLLDPAWTFINHGAFGAVARRPMEVAHRWRLHAERQPLLYTDRVLFPWLVHSLRLVAPRLGLGGNDSNSPDVGAAQMVWLPNVTAGLNAAMRSCLSPGDEVWLLGITYGATKKIVQSEAVSQIPGDVKVREIPFEFPLDGSLQEEDVLGMVRQELEKTSGRPPKMFIFDHITSNTATLMPVAALTRLCREHGVERVLVDGAHAPGQLLPTASGAAAAGSSATAIAAREVSEPLPTLDLSAIGADYYIGNCHKWLCAPRGSAFMAVRPGLQASTHAAVQSHGYGSGMLSEFLWDGCRDYTPLLAVPAAYALWDWIGQGTDEHVRYTRQLRAQAVQLLGERWSVRCANSGLPLVSSDAMLGNMALVQLPHAATSPGSNAATSADAKAVQDWLHSEKCIEVPVKCVQGALYVRISAHVYNEIADYEILANAGLECPYLV